MAGSVAGWQPTLVTNTVVAPVQPLATSSSRSAEMVRSVSRFSESFRLIFLIFSSPGFAEAG
jgi:hypothetical protein